jgi:hypothetical protein
MPLFSKFIIFLTFIHTIQSHSVHPSPFAEARLLESSSRSLSKGSLHGMPRRDSNSGLPYSKPTHEIFVNKCNKQMYSIQNCLLLEPYITVLGSSLPRLCKGHSWASKIQKSNLSLCARPTAQSIPPPPPRPFTQRRGPGYTRSG